MTSIIHACMHPWLLSGRGPRIHQVTCLIRCLSEFRQWQLARLDSAQLGSCFTAKFPRTFFFVGPGHSGSRIGLDKKVCTIWLFRTQTIIRPQFFMILKIKTLTLVKGLFAWICQIFRIFRTLEWTNDILLISLSISPSPIYSNFNWYYFLLFYLY